MADTKNAAPVATPEETEAFREAQSAEYGTYIALVPIAFNGVPAYNPGDPVPVSNVERHGYDDSQVAKVDSSAAQKLLATIHATTTDQQPVEVAPPVPLSTSIKK